MNNNTFKYYYPLTFPSIKKKSQKTLHLSNKFIKICLLVIIAHNHEVLVERLLFRLNSFRFRKTMKVLVLKHFSDY